jgi:peroxiredoxin
MSTLKERLDRIKAGFLEKVPAEAKAIMDRDTEELRASGILSRMPAPGSTLPPFELPDSEGRIVRSSELLEKGPLILTFYRGVWWPYCNTELYALQQKYDEIRGLGAELVAISPQAQEKNAEVKSKHRLAFPVLSDLGNSYARSLSIVHALPVDLQAIYRKFEIVLPDFNGDDSWELPLPTRMVVDGQGTIRSVDADPDYTIRPEPEESIEVLRTLG